MRCAALQLAYIRVTVIPVARPSWVRVVLLPVSVAVVLKPKRQPVVDVIEPPKSALVSAPPAARLNPSVAGWVVLVTNRQDAPAPESRRNDIPITWTLTFVIAGRVPVKLAYRMCHGSDACRTVIAAPLQAPAFTVLLLIKPIRAPALFVMTFE